jgi:adenine-specific DNA-methyltransferase
MTMQKIEVASPEAQSANLVAENVAQLKALFPELVTEGPNGPAVNLDVLKALVGDAMVTDAEEKYGLNWHGKRAARQLALTPSTGTLRPCPDESVDWDSTKNLMIEGDNLEVLKLLQKSYASKVKLIFIDPPYNTGKDFVYPDNFQDSIKNYMELTGQVEGGRKISSNTEASGRFHTDWLNMIYPRLKVAHSLLRPDGAIFVSIDSGEAANLQLVLNEIFGEENHVVTVVWQKRVSPANDAKWFSSDHDLLLVYAKNKEIWRPNKLARTGEQLAYYKNPDNDPRGDWNSATYTCPKTRAERPNLYYPIRNPNTGEDVWPKETAVWKFGPDVTATHVAEGRLYWGADGRAAFPRIKLYLSEMDNVVPRSVWSYEDVGHTQAATTELKALFDGAQVFDSPKPLSLLQRVIELGCKSSDDIILDFFAGSGTTGHAAMIRAAAGSGTRFILVQVPEPVTSESFKTIAEITRERLIRAKRSLDMPIGDADLGFRTFKLDYSNIRAWRPDSASLASDLIAHEDHIVEGRTESDLLYELLLKLGLDLCVPLASKTIAGKTLKSVAGGVLITCLESSVGEHEVEAIAHGIVAWHKEMAPAGDTTCVFRDSAFADDVAKTNMAAILEQNGIQNVRSL